MCGLIYTNDHIHHWYVTTTFRDITNVIQLPVLITLLAVLRHLWQKGAMVVNDVITSCKLALTRHQNTP